MIRRSIPRPEAMSRLFPSLKLEEDGIWRAPMNESLSYPENGHRSLIAVEDRSFWFQHRNRCIQAMLRRFPIGESEPMIDIGGGNGVVSKALQESGQATILLEPGADGARNAYQRGIEFVAQATLEGSGARKDSLPGVGLFDVVEHIEDDTRFMSQLHDLLRPKARVYLSVPAHQWLWSHEDVAAGHFRRYDTSGLRRLARDSGFGIDFMTFFFWPLALPIALLRCLPFRLSALAGQPFRSRTVEDDHGSDHLAARAILKLVRFEADRIGAAKTIPFGASCLAVLVKQ